jgi:hypothetical protein
MSEVVVWQPSDARKALSFSDGIKPGGHEYMPQHYPIELAESFDQFSRACMNYFAHDDVLYPNATMIAEPYPADMYQNAVSFMVVWGSGTEIPHPRVAKLPEYFGELSVRLARFRRKSLHKTVLDGHGFVGRVSLAEGSSILRVAVGANDSEKLRVIGSWLPGYEGNDLLVTEIVANLKFHRPLRFHAGVKFHGNNGYIGNEFYPDDECDALHRV